MLNKLFPSSFAVGKRVRTETGLAEGAVSVSFAATALARKIFGDLKGRTVLVVGAGEMGKLTAQHLQSQGVERMLITSRTLAHAAALAESIGGEALPWDGLRGALDAGGHRHHAPPARRCRSSPGRRSTRSMRHRRNRPLFLIDIALPRDVDPAVGDLDAVFLYNIDDLQAIVQENLSRRAAEVARAEAIVADEVRKFEAWLHRAGRHPDRRRAAAAVRGDPAVRARTPPAEARWPAARRRGRASTKSPG